MATDVQSDVATDSQDPRKKRPLDSVTIGGRITVWFWGREGRDGNKWVVYTLTKQYSKDGEIRHSTSFGSKDNDALAKAVRVAGTLIDDYQERFQRGEITANGAAAEDDGDKGPF